MNQRKALIHNDFLYVEVSPTLPRDLDMGNLARNELT